MPQLICLGAGGHASVVLDAAESAGFDVAGALDRDGAPAVAQGRWPVLGGDELLPGLVAQGMVAAIGLGGTGDNSRRRDLYERAAAAGAELPAIVHPSAVVSASAELGPGTVVLAGAIVNAGAALGADVIVNTGALIEHDCTVEDHAHLSPGSVLGGAVRVGEGAHVGLGATVREGLAVGASALIGAGAVVLGDVPAGATWVGVPARPHE
ncbi:MAG: acetyltransferase [Thermoleophilaceae bacterium]|nr:acetyltransferase [Thermoleophilaceae bacterium]